MVFTGHYLFQDLRSNRQEFEKNSRTEIYDIINMFQYDQELLVEISKS